MGNITPEDVLAVVGILGTIGAIFLYFHKPQEDLDKRQLIADKELDSKATVLAQKEMENKAALLAQQVESEKILNEKKFTEMNTKIDTSILVLQKDIQIVDSKVNNLVSSNATFHLDMSNKMVELSTILRERLPQKL
jgi:hypothetical protein